VRHRWQLDGVVTLAEATDALRAVADELEAAHGAGWWLSSRSATATCWPSARPDDDARRNRSPHRLPSRRRACPAGACGWSTSRPAPATRCSTPLQRRAPRSCAPTARGCGRSAGRRWPTRCSPSCSDSTPHQDARGWAVAPARVGPAHDLVADGSALRVHAVEEGRLVRTLEAVSFVHAADRATTLLAAAAAYRRLADATDRMAAVGGRLDGVDDGLLHVAYGRR
jgi:hypothetical protein